MPPRPSACGSATRRAGLRTLGAALGGRPAVLVFADYTCTTLCGTAPRRRRLPCSRAGLPPGADYAALVVGLDPQGRPGRGRGDEGARARDPTRGRAARTVPDRRRAGRRRARPRRSATATPTTGARPVRPPRRRSWSCAPTVASRASLPSLGAEPRRPAAGARGGGPRRARCLRRPCPAALLRLRPRAGRLHARGPGASLMVAGALTSAGGLGGGLLLLRRRAARRPRDERSGLALCPPAASTEAASTDFIFSAAAGDLAAVILLLSSRSSSPSRSATAAAPGAPRGELPAFLRRDVEIGWTAATLFVALFLFWWAGSTQLSATRPAARTRSRSMSSPSSGCGRRSTRTARARSTSCTCPLGEPVRLVMTSQDVIHSFFVPAFRHEAGRAARPLHRDVVQRHRSRASTTCSAPSSAAPTTPAWAAASR